MLFAQENSELNIYAIYLGESDKGDATLLESKGHGLLIDIGSASQTGVIVEQLRKVGLTHVDVLFSHLHSDHIGSTHNNITAGLENLEAMGICVGTGSISDTVFDTNQLQSFTITKLCRSKTRYEYCISECR